MAIRESSLETISNIATSDFVRAVTSTGASRKVTVANLIDTISNNLPTASTSAKGVMSASDKVKLDGIASGAEANLVDDVQIGGASIVSNKVANIPKANADNYGAVKLSTQPGQARFTFSSNDSTVDVATISPVNNTISSSVMPDATTSSKGAMSAADKTKLNGIETGAEVNVQSDWEETDSSSDSFILNKPTLLTLPIGSVFESTSSTNPSTNLGNTWTLCGTAGITSADVMITSAGNDIVTSESDTLGFGIVSYKFERTA